jgi:hypothetical protein
MALKRVEDWPEKMHAFIEDRVGDPFAWGSNDCALFVCDHILNITGVDVAAEFRGKYTDKDGAFAVIKDVAGGASTEDVAEFITKKYGMTELTNLNFAQRGDIVMFDDSEDGSALGVVHLNGIHALFVGDKGLQRTRLSLCRRCWKVGA